MDLVLSLNAGSSSLKISVYTTDLDLLTTSSVSVTSDHKSAFTHFIDTAHFDTSRIKVICHRIVHGGDYADPVIINTESLHYIQHLSDLAPLHNGAALSVIDACLHSLPLSKSVAYFDSAFHRSIPFHIATYSIDQNIASQRGLKKYGFHGLSYAFILRAVSEHLQKQPESLNLILLHLGSGASACAIKNGKSLDTSMGLTPLSGLPGATRSGEIDPSLIFHYTNKAARISHDPNMTTDLGITTAEDILNRKAGWKAITGTTDFGTIVKNAQLSIHDPLLSSKNPFRLAFDLFVDRILNYIGAYYLKLNGNVDALVFAGGIGERSIELRSVVAEKVRCLGFNTLDEKLNISIDNVVVDISEGTGKRILVCKTDEQLEMARQCTLDKQFW